MATIREQLKDTVLDDRKDAAKSTKFDKLDIVRADTAGITIPRLLRPEKLVEAVKVWADAESKIVSVREEILGIPIDAAHALMLAVKEEFGVVELHGCTSFFGSTPPPFFSIPTSADGDTVDVYVGEFTLPGFEGAKFSTAPDESGLKLIVAGTLRQKDMSLFKQLVATARRLLSTHSLYKGKPITINFGKTAEDSEGENQEMIIPTFWDVSKPKELILAADTEAMIRATIWTPIEHREKVKAMGTPIKRGILLYGKFGTGKTLTAYETARKSVANGFTFIYVKDVRHLQKAIEFASLHYLPAVVFMEDTEKAFEDPGQVNAIQNTMDGIDGKSRDLIVVLTTNFVDKLPPAIMRPGRLDTIIPLKEADPATAARLVRLYAGDSLDADSDMEAIGRAVKGNIPAAIREVVERAKLFALARVGDLGFQINHTDIVFAAKGMEEHMALLNGTQSHQVSPVEVLGSVMGAQIAEGVRSGIAALVNGAAFEADAVGSGR